MEKKTADILDKYRLSERGGLIPLLQEIQSLEGYISEDAIREVGELLGISTTKIFSLASFYDGFRFSPPGKVHIKICNGTSCYINRNMDIPGILRDELKLDEGDRSADGRYSLELVDCMGACHLGPHIYVDGNYYTVRTDKELKRLIEKIRSDG